jgi:S1-C subfamily serine protease
MKRQWIAAILLLAVLVACGTPNATPVPTVDKEEIARQVLVELENRLAAQQQAATPVPTLDAQAIISAVLTDLEAQRPQSTLTAVPTLDTNRIATDVLATLASQPRLSAQSELEAALIEVYKRANPAVVFIIDAFGSSGSGFVYDVDGHVVTNNHVVAAGTEFEIIFANGERRRGELVGADADADLAVLRVQSLPEGVAPLPLAAPNALEVGQFVVAIGNPFGEQGSMSLGIVSGLDRSLPSQRGDLDGSRFSLPEVIQTDAPINPGNSGGPLLNLEGEVVGVNAALASRTGTNSGVGFSIPVDAVRQVVPSLIENGAYVYPYMGAGFANDISLTDQEVFGLTQNTGAYVISVAAASPAAEAGLIAADASGRGGDLIIKLDSQEVNNFSDLNSYLVFHTQVGQTIAVTVLRNGEPVVLSLTLVARP